VRVCALCGQQDPEIARFCLACGQALDTATAPRAQERKLVTVLLGDVIGSTGLGEQLDAEELEQVAHAGRAAVARMCRRGAYPTAARICRCCFRARSTTTCAWTVAAIPAPMTAAVTLE
jgi:hypothetical protein